MYNNELSQSLRDAIMAVGREESLDEAKDFSKMKDAELLKHGKDKKAQAEMKKRGLNEGAEKDVKGDDAAYKAFFKKALAKFDVTEPDQLEGAKKKEFFDYVDANWKADDEKAEGVNPFAKKDDDKDEKSDEKSEKKDDDKDDDDEKKGGKPKKGVNPFAKKDDDDKDDDDEKKEEVTVDNINDLVNKIIANKSVSEAHGDDGYDQEKDGSPKTSKKKKKDEEPADSEKDEVVVKSGKADADKDKDVKKEAKLDEAAPKLKVNPIAKELKTVAAKAEKEVRATELRFGKSSKEAKKLRQVSKRLNELAKDFISLRT